MATAAGLFATQLGGTWTNLGVGPGNQTVVLTLMDYVYALPVTVTGTAFDRRTANGASTVQLVAPASVRLFQGLLGHIPAIGVMTLQFGPVVPESATLLLLGAGLAGLATFARHRERRG